MKWQDGWESLLRPILDAEDIELIELCLRSWLHQLQAEYLSINATYQLGLTPPVLALTADKSGVYGSWHKSGRGMNIDSHLIIERGWSATLLVLKHEMAHQLVDEKLGGSNRPHDEVFRAACRMLDLPAAFCRATIDARAFDEAEQEGRGERPFVERVKKLFALSKSANMHEAAAALAKARQLLARHQLDEVEVADEAVIYLPINLTTLRISGVTRSLISIISKFFPVSVIETKMYDPWRNESLPMYEVFGRRGAAHFAVHCYHFLTERMESLWQDERARGDRLRAGRRERDSFMLGLLRGVEESLTKGQTEQRETAESRALAAMNIDPEVRERLNRRYPNTRRRSMAGRRVSHDEYEKGMAAGRKIKLNAAVNQGGAGKLLSDGRPGSDKKS